MFPLSVLRWGNLKFGDMIFISKQVRYSRPTIRRVKTVQWCGLWLCVSVFHPTCLWRVSVWVMVHDVNHDDNQVCQTDRIWNTNMIITQLQKYWETVENKTECDVLLNPIWHKRNRKQYQIVHLTFYSINYIRSFKFSDFMSATTFNRAELGTKELELKYVNY